MTVDMADARAGRKRIAVSELLLCPFRYVAGARSLALGLAAILAAGFIGGLSRTYFDGVLDMHTGLGVPRGLFLGAGFIDWLSLSLVLWLMGKLVSRTAFRAVDLFGTQALARWPTVVAALAALAPPFQRLMAGLAAQFPGAARGAGFSLPVGDVVLGGLAALVMVVGLVWMVWLMYGSYAICCNLRGGKAVGTFIAGLLVAEIVSKLALGLIFRM